MLKSLIMALILFPAGSQQLPDQLCGETGEPLLALREVYAVSLPDSLGSFRAALAPGAPAFFWVPGTSISFSMAESGAGPEVLNQPTEIIAGGFFERPSRLELFARDGDSILELVKGRNPQWREVFGGPDLPPAGAAPGPSGWYMLAADRQGETVLYSVSDGRVASPVARFPNSDPQAFALSPSRKGLLLTEKTAPFRVLGLNQDNVLQEILRPPPSMVSHFFEGPGRSGFRLLSMPALELDRGFLQILTSPSVDERVLLLYGSDGGFLRCRTIDAALAFVAALPERRILIGGRNFGVSEVVFYEWSWSEPIDKEMT